jgi:bifunctional polynucleotide phosphatase/kinase
MEECIYVGDAAGRKKNKNVKADHSNVDYKFALNLGCRFMLPETFFLD